MQTNPEIEQIVNAAVKMARDSHHEYVMTEHVLLSLINHDPFRRVLEKFGTDLVRLQQELESYIGNIDTVVAAAPVPPKKTNGWNGCLIEP